MKNRVKSGFFEVINSSSTSVCIKITSYCIPVFACAHQVRKCAYRWSRTCSIGFMSSYQIIVGLIYI